MKNKKQIQTIEEIADSLESLNAELCQLKTIVSRLGNRFGDLAQFCHDSVHGLHVAKSPLTLAQTAKALNISPSQVAKLIERGSLLAFNISARSSRSWRIDSREIERFKRDGAIPPQPMKRKPRRTWPERV